MSKKERLLKEIRENDKLDLPIDLALPPAAATRKKTNFSASMAKTAATSLVAPAAPSSVKLAAARPLAATSLDTLAAAAAPSPVKPAAAHASAIKQVATAPNNVPRINPPNMNHNFSLFLNKNPHLFCDYVVQLSNLYNALGPSNSQSMMNHLMQTMHLLQARHAIDRYNSYQSADEKISAEEVMEFVRSKRRKIDEPTDEKTPTQEEKKE